MTKKIALFVEGQTEVIFISEMIRQVFNVNKIKILVHNMTYNRMRTDIYKTDTTEEYYFLLYNCGTDNKVKSNIKDNYQNLQQANFIHIIGLQDLFNPQRRKEEFDDKKFQETINADIPQTIPAKIYFAIQEIEAWFIAEETHYQKISSALSIEKVNFIAGIDIQKEDTQKIPHPTVVLDKIYKAGDRKKGYSKNEYTIKDIVSKLDFSNLYLTVRNRNNSLNELLTCLDGLIP
jgi:hypothetical protein